jgi:signal transduction histidine kinase
MTTFLGVPILLRGGAWGNLYLTDKLGGSEFSEEDERAVGMLADWAAIAIDNARRFQEVRGRRDELERTLAAMRATVEIARALAGETDLDVILQLIAKRGRALVEARTLVIELIVGDRMRIVALAGDADRDLMGAELPIARSASGQALRAGRPQRLSDELVRARFEEAGLGRLGVKAADGLFVPLTFRNETPGVLVALDPVGGGTFSAENERLLSSFAVSAASAVITARSVTSEQMRAREHAAEDERRRWSRELHDETLQGLGALRLALAAARRAEDPARWRAALDDAIAELDAEIDNVRGIISDVRPAVLDELGAEAALDSLVERMRRRGIEVEMTVDLAFQSGRAATRHDEETETAIYRIVQESLTNAIKHAEATAATVTVVEDDGFVLVQVRDEGRGFDPSAPASASEFGLIGMRERAESLGGALTLEAQPGAGTTVTARLPVRHRPAGDARSSLRRVG